jgi:hypothetical protein
LQHRRTIARELMLQQQDYLALPARFEEPDVEARLV